MKENEHKHEHGEPCSCHCHEEKKECHDHHDHHEHHDHDHHDHHDHHDSCGCHCHCEEEHGHDGCSCGHSHEAPEGKKSIVILRYTLGAIPVILGFLPFLPLPVRIVASAIGYLLFGFEVWYGMIRGFAKKNFFTEFTLMCVATVCAFCIGEYADGAAVMYLYSLGETLSGGAYARSRRNLSELLEITPEYANVVRDGEVLRVSPEDVAVGECILVRSGERIPLDGTVSEGGGSADSSSVTGESKPLELYEGVFCPSGCILSEGTVYLRVEADAKNSVVSRLAEAVKEATARKSTAEKRITRFARLFTPLAFSVALGIFLIGFAVTGQVTEWLRAAAVVLVVSCPCSLVLSVPLTYFAGIGAAARQGIVFRGGEVMDRMEKIGAICFDKTGTLTESELSFDGAEVFGTTEKEEFLSLAYDVLIHSPHAAAVSFCRTRERVAHHQVSSVEIQGGRGVVCLSDGKETRFGNAALMRDFGIDLADHTATAIFGARDGILLGRLDFSAHLKEGAAEAVSELKRMGVERIALLSGDGAEAVRESARQVGIEEAYSALAPHQKAEVFRRIAHERKEKSTDKPLSAFCGDGLNDSAVIAGADVGIAMGGAGSALTVSSADAVLMDDDPRKLVAAIRVAKRTAGIATQNIILSLGIKLAVLLVGVLTASVSGEGIPMGLAIVADVGAAILAVLNALRAAKIKK